MSDTVLTVDSFLEVPNLSGLLYSMSGESDGAALAFLDGFLGSTTAYSVTGRQLAFSVGFPITDYTELRIVYLSSAVIGDVTPYIDLVTSEHKDKPKFIATLTASLQPLADLLVTLGIMNGIFDLDTAVGDQLLKIGQWIGLSNIINIPITGVYFSWNIPGQGWNQAPWFSPGDARFTSVTLDDPTYRQLLRAKVLQNQWDGSIEGAYAIWDTLFAGTGLTVYIIDHGDLTITMGMTATGAPPTPTQLALFQGGYISTKPATIGILGYILPGGSGTTFAFDLNTSSFSGFDTGTWS